MDYWAKSCCCLGWWYVCLLHRQQKCQHCECQYLINWRFWNYLFLMFVAARQPLFLVILSRSIYLSMFVRRFSPLQRAGQHPDAWHNISKTVYGQTAGVHNYFPAHCAGVTNMSSRYNLSPTVKIYRRHRVWYLAAPAKKRLPTCRYYLFRHWCWSRVSIWQASSLSSESSPATLSKLERVKMFVELLIKTIRNEDMLAIVTFGTTARVVLPLRRMADDAKVLSFVHSFIFCIYQICKHIQI